MKPTICPKCNGSIISVEYYLLDPDHYDGVSEYACSNSFREKDRDEKHTNVLCSYRIGRFCGQPLNDGEVEPPFCKGIHTKRK